MIAPLCLACVVQASTVWYGPAEVSFSLPAVGNPYDPEKNNLSVSFRLANGTEEKRLAYWDDGKWKARLTAKKRGQYTARLLKDGRATNLPSVKVMLNQPLAGGYVRRSGARFKLDSGEVFFPVGHNLGWQSPNYPKLAEQIAMMGKNGLNWSRIWANHWDGKSPFFPESGQKLNQDELNATALDRWDDLVFASQKHGVRMQFVLFHHGAFSSRVNPNWPEHPWNAKNGGFLARAEDFFTDPEASRRTNMWLRYAVARYGWSPAIMAWEMFNEVEWVDARYANRWNDIGAWHDQKADYLRSIDPVGRLITTSSEVNEPIWRKMDYLQPHAYPPNVAIQVLGTRPKDQRPFFFGEVGTGQFVPSQERGVVRDAIWSGLLAGHAGAAQYWYWDRMLPKNEGPEGFYPEYRIATAYWKKHGLGTKVALAPSPIKLEAELGGDLKFSPGRGWGATEVFEFNLPEDAAPGKLSQFSSYIQGDANRPMMKQPITFKFKADRPGAFRVDVNSASTTGGKIVLSLNGGPASEVVVGPGSSADRQLRQSLSVDFPAGTHTVMLNGTGPDWVQISGISVTGIGPSSTGSFAQSNGVWLGRVKQLRPGAASIAGFPRDGMLKGDILDLDTGKTIPLSGKVTGGKLSLPKQMPKDAIVRLASSQSR